MSEEQDPFEPVVRATVGEGARRTVTKAFDAPSAIPSPLEAIESARKQARAELRDRFAMAALTGMMAANYEFTDRVAEETYEIADAMLRARANE